MEALDTAIRCKVNLIAEKGGGGKEKEEHRANRTRLQAGSVTTTRTRGTPSDRETHCDVQF